MPHYIRTYVPGGSYFFTVALLERRRCLLTEQVDALRAAFVSVRRQRPFHINAIVILPDHLHCLWTLPPDDADYSTRWRLIKASFARTLAPGERLSERRQRKGERGIWQRRFWEHTIRDQRDFERHCDYLHYNPVKHGYVARVADWPYSSFHRFVKNRIYPLGWAGHPETIDAVGFGEGSGNADGSHVARVGGRQPIGRPDQTRRAPRNRTCSN